MHTGVKIAIVGGVAAAGFLVGICGGFIGQFLVHQSQGSISDSYALGMICGGGVLGMGAGAVAAVGLVLLFGGSRPSRKLPDMPNPWEDEEPPRRGRR
jgi:hypothetical protein